MLWIFRRWLRSYQGAAECGLVACVLFASTSSQADVKWVPVKPDAPPSIPLGLTWIDPGPETNAPSDRNNKGHFVCRAPFAGAVHPGKFVAFRCNIAYGGQEKEIKDFELAAAPADSFYWAPPGESAKVVFGGRDANQSYPVCRARYIASGVGTGRVDHGVQAGKVVDAHCHIGWGGGEIAITPYDVLYERSTSTRKLTTSDDRKLYSLSDLSADKQKLLSDEIEKYGVVIAAMRRCGRPADVEGDVRRLSKGCVTEDALDAVDAKLRAEIALWDGPINCKDAKLQEIMAKAERDFDRLYQNVEGACRLRRLYKWIPK